jgi:ribosome-associated protein|tara:strand:- start:266 stop:769 length:504 start_codon:yes stop_codon:yes gene_type:complete
MKYEPDTELEPPSKTRLKQGATDLQQLGQKLTTYSCAVLRKLSLNEVLISALEEYNRLPNSHGARRRQLQFIGKLMRDLDYDAVIKSIDDLESGHLRKKKKPSAAKLLCEAILESGDAEINAALEQYPQLSRQTMRQLYREYNRAAETSRDKFKTKLQNYLQKQVSS